MKVLLISDFYPPHRGGLEHHVKALARQLAARGHEVHVASLADSDSKGSLSDGVSLHFVPGLPRVLPFLSNDRTRRYPLPTLDPLSLRSLQRLVKHVRPDIAHSHGWSTLTALHLDLPIVATLHDSGLFCPKRTLLRSSGHLCQEGPGLRCVSCAREQYGLAKSAGVLAAMQLNQASLMGNGRYIAVSKFVRDAHLKHAGIPPERITVIPNFHREEEGRQTEARPSPLSLPPRFILYVGYMARFKGAHVLLDAYRRLETDVPLVMIGYPAEDIPVTDPRVVVVDGADHSEVMRAFDECVFAVVPSVIPDSLPTVALEAMSSGKAVVASNIGGIPDAVASGENGYLVPPGDAAALAAKMSELLDNPSLARQFGETGRMRLQAEFSAEVVVPRIEDTYRMIVGC